MEKRSEDSHSTNPGAGYDRRGNLLNFSFPRLLTIALAMSLNATATHHSDCQQMSALRRKLPMAHVTDTYIKTCHCCGLTALVKEWSCGCVTLSYDRSAKACGDCDSFMGMEESCGKPGYPSDE